MPELPKRKTIRLQNYDYSQNGYYFVTICTHGKQELFETSTVGNDPCVVPSKFQANKIIEKWLLKLENKFDIKIEYYIIMSDHVHFILSKTNDTGTERHMGRSLPEMLQWFKTMTTNEYIKCVKNGTLQPFDKKLWQKSYYEHIIRNEDEYIQTLEYIMNNPLKRELKKNE